MTTVQQDGFVEFWFYRPNAANVVVAGDFTGWAEKPMPMTSAGNGWWTAKARLNGGDYRFRYIADGDWYTDYAAFGVELSRQGWNSVLIVPEVEIAVQQLEQETEAARIAA